MATVIDTLFLELGIDSSKFSGEAAKAEKQYDRLERSVSKVEKAEKNAAKTTKENSEARRKSVVDTQKADVSMQGLLKTVNASIKGFAAFTGLLLGASGLSKLALDAAKANRELDTTAKNLGMARKELSAWQGAAEMAGESANGMSGYMKTLSGDMQSLIMMGDTSVLPYFNALGVSLLDSTGKARKLDDVMLDLADRFSTMDRQQAYTLAQQMGIDDGTFNTLSRGRAEMERMLEIQRDMYHSSEADIENSRKLAEARAVLNARWESLKLMIGNALIPVLTTLTEIVSGFVGFLVKHEHVTKGVFLGIASAIGIFLVPMLVTATAAVFAFIAPFAPLIAAVAGLGAAFGLLYDDYKTWAEGGKSLFDWGRFTSYINSSKVSTDSLGKSFIYLTTGYTSWSEAANGMLDWMRLKGFIDGNTVSVGSLMNGFKNLASELSDGLMPYLMDIVEIFNRLKEGDFSGAGEAVKVAFKRRWEAVKSFAGAAWDRVTGTVDVATGHDVGTLSGGNSAGGSAVDNMVSGIDGKVSQAAAFAVKHAAKRSLKQCALYVNNALRAQGIRSSGNGVDVASNLLKSGQGFHQVAYSKDYVPQIGDVMSMKSNSRSGHNWGHVAIYTKEGWVSDFKQGEKYGNTGAASAQYWKEIQSGRIVPIIARRGGGGGGTRSAIAVTGKEDWLNKINAKDTVSNADSRLSAVSQKYGIPQHMLYSVWAQESRKGNMKKSSAAGAKGHFQFMPGTAKAYGISGREWDFDASSDAAARYFQWLLRHYGGDHNKALAAYNWGNGNLDKAIKRYGNDWLSHAPKETQGYVNSINKMMAYKGRGGMMSRPLGGQDVAQNLSNQQGRINASRGAANPHNVSNTQNTQITVNGGINVQTSASTVRGNVQDAMDGLNSRAGQYAVAQM
jgi:putative transglycosylase|nr:MAG TPA: tail tape measure [Caudoviricetes sp.]